MIIFQWFYRAHEMVMAESKELMKRHGDSAYTEARKAMRAARGRGDGRQEKFYARVALEIAKRTEIEIGLDTATRYVEEQAPYEPGPGFVRKPDATLH